jgi:hypothetical protein
MKISKKAGEVLLIVAVSITCINMGGGGDSMNTVKEPLFSKLERDETSFKATISDDGKTTEIKDISFGGKITIGGIRREEDSAIIEVDLGKIKELIIKKKTYSSERYSDKEFVLIDYLSPDGTKVTNLLFPHNIVVSGVSLKPAMNYAWKLRDVERISINHPTPA